MSEVLPDPGELNVPVPDAPDTVIPFEAISGKAQEQEKSEQEPEQQPPEQGEQPKPEVEKADKPDAYGQALCQQLHVDPMCRVG